MRRQQTNMQGKLADTASTKAMNRTGVTFGDRDNKQTGRTGMGLGKTFEGSVDRTGLATVTEFSKQGMTTNRSKCSWRFLTLLLL